MSGLFNSTILDVAIGLVFVFLLLAIICTTVNEWIAGVLRTRSKMLEASIKQLLDSQKMMAAAEGPAGAAAMVPVDFLKVFYNHPLITGMMRDSQHPSYLSSATFSMAVMDLVTQGREASMTFADLESGIAALPEGDVKTALMALIQHAHGDLEEARKAIEGWFDSAMDRCSGWYKRHTQIVTVVIAAIVTIAANADTIHIGRRLRSDPVVRNAIVEQAKIHAQQDPGGNKDVLSPEERASLGGVLGWQGFTTDKSGDGFLDWFERVIGWILTIVAVSLGAPFWFDILNKFMNLRTAGKSPDETAKKSGK